MRWIWIDRFVEFESGVRAVALKNVSLAEEHLHDHFPGYPTMPGSLMLEGMAQTGGILLGQKHDFEQIVVLAKVPKVSYERLIGPGETIRYEATVADDRPEGGTTAVTATVDGETVAEAEIMFAYLDKSDPAYGGVDQKNFVFESALMGAFEAGRGGSVAL